MATDALGRALVRVVETLRSLHGESTRPHAVVAALDAISGEAGIPIFALSEYGPAHRGTHVALIDLPDGATVSVGLCPPDADPWILLAARSWSERDVLQVDGAPLCIQDVIRYLDSMWRDRNVLKQLVDLGIVRNEIQRRRITVAPADVDSAVDALRRGLGLLGAEATRTWLAERGMQEVDLEAYGADHAAIRKLRSQVIDPREIEELLASHRHVASEIEVLRARFVTRDDARRFASWPPPADAPLSEYRAMAGSRCSRLEIVRLRAASWATIFETTSISVGDVIERPDGDYFTVFVVLAVGEATSEDELRDQIEQLLFSRWLERRRATAKVEWYWGKGPVDAC